MGRALKGTPGLKEIGLGRLMLLQSLPAREEGRRGFKLKNKGEGERVGDASGVAPVVAAAATGPNAGGGGRVAAEPWGVDRSTLASPVATGTAPLGAAWGT